MTRKLEGKVAVVTGSSTGIGAAIAKAMAAEGASVIVNYKTNAIAAAEIVQTIVDSGGSASSFKCDVSRKADADRLIEEAIERFGKIDILVNNAGYAEFARIEDFSEKLYQDIFNVNVLGTFWATSAAVRHMSDGACIINISSVAPEWAPFYSSVYAASKGAIDALTSALANELGSRKTRVNAIKPGTILTEKVAAAREHIAEMLNTLTAQTPMGRLGTPEDVASVAVFLATDYGFFISGDHIAVSGGFHAS